jgi:hypothetical protein
MQNQISECFPISNQLRLPLNDAQDENRTVALSVDVAMPEWWCRMISARQIGWLTWCACILGGITCAAWPDRDCEKVPARAAALSSTMPVCPGESCPHCGCKADQTGKCSGSWVHATPARDVNLFVDPEYDDQTDFLPRKKKPFKRVPILNGKRYGFGQMSLASDALLVPPGAATANVPQVTVRSTADTLTSLCVRLQI